MDVFRITSIVLHDDDFFLNDIHSLAFSNLAYSHTPKLLYLLVSSSMYNQQKSLIVSVKMLLYSSFDLPVLNLKS